MNAAGNSNDRAADDSATANTPAESLTPGELLRRERERRSLPQLHIAEELHLDVRVVDAIEANRFDELGVPVYARGHLRQYAALLGLSPQFIIERYEALTGHQAPPPPIPASVAVGTSVGMERRSLAGPLWMGVALVALTLGWWIWSSVSEPGDPMQSALQEESVAGASFDDTAETSQSAVLDEPAPVPGATEAAPAGSPAVALETATNVTPAPGDIRMRLEFSDASWAEIYDANGKRLMFGLGESGAARTVSGTPPLQVTLGKASAVTVQVNDRPIVVPRRAGKDAAKFVIAAGGTVQ